MNLIKGNETVISEKIKELDNKISKHNLIGRSVPEEAEELILRVGFARSFGLSDASDRQNLVCVLYLNTSSSPNSPDQLKFGS